MIYTRHIENATIMKNRDDSNMALHNPPEQMHNIAIEKSEIGKKLDFATFMQTFKNQQHTHKQRNYQSKTMLKNILLASYFLHI